MRDKIFRCTLVMLLVLSMCGCSVWDRVAEPKTNNTAEPQPAETASLADSISESPVETVESPEESAVGPVGYETPFTKMEFLREVADVYQMAHDNGFVYGDSHGTPPCSDGVISCDRLIARALWNLGFTDQPEGGFIVEEEEDYLTRHGFEKIEEQDELRGGDIVIQCNEEGHLIHSFVLVYYDPITTECIKYDCGHFTPEGADRISSKQPFYTVLADFPERKFYCGFRIRESYENKSEAQIEAETELSDEETEPSNSDLVEMRLNALSTEAKVAQLFFLTPDQLSGESGIRYASDYMMLGSKGPS